MAQEQLTRQPGGGAPSRLPQPERHEGHRALRGTLFLLGSLALLVGVPVGLVLAVGNPLPTSPPTRDWLTADVSAGLVIDVLAVVVWLVWVHFVVCFLTEWRAVRAGRMPGRVVMGGGSQVLARQLVAGILLLAGGASVAHGTTALAADAPGEPRGGVAAVLAAPTPAVSQQVVLEAEAAAEAAARPAAAPAARETKSIEVKPPRGRNHDTMWDIADRTLGDPFRYREIFELNRGRLQADGSRLTDADLIKPGWQLLLPADASGPGVTVTRLSTPGGTATGPAVADAASTSTQPASDAVRAADAAADDLVTASGSADTAVDARQERGAGLTELLVGGGLLLAGVARAVTARRGPHGEPDADAAALQGAAAVRRADLLDDALRSLAEMRSAQDAPMPELLFAYVDDEQVVLHLAARTAAPEAPWTVADDESSWSLRATDLVAPSDGVAAPYPCLVNVAESHGFDLLVDLEMAPGLVSLGGDGDVAREVAMAMLLDLSTHRWADDIDLVMVGFAEDLGDLDTRRVRQAGSLDDVLAEAERGRSGYSAVARSLGLTGVLQGRQRGAADACTPMAVFLSGPPTAEQAQRLGRLTSGGRTSFAVVSVGGSPSARWRLVVDSSGGFDGGVLGVRGTARRLTGAGRRRLHALLTAAAERREAGERQLDTTPTCDLATTVLRRPLPEEPVTPAAEAPADAAATAAAAVTRTVDELATAPATLRLLGPVRLEAPGPVAPERRELLTEVVTMAVLHSDGLHEAVLRAALWPRGVEREVVEARLADAQAWLGTDPSGAPRLRRGDDGRWHLTGVATDYGVLAHAAAGDDRSRLLSALALGSGEVFSGPGRHYGWLAFAREARTARLLATSAARRAAELAGAAGDPAQALEALRLGMVLVPTAEVLWRLLLRELSSADPDAVDAEITQMYSVLSQHGVRPEPETDALVTELAPRRGGAVGS